MRNNHIFLGGGERQMIAGEGFVAEDHHLASPRHAVQIERTKTIATKPVQEGQKAAGHRLHD